MRLATPILGGVAAAAVMAAGGGVCAQEADPSARYDIDDALHRRPHDVSELPSVEEARGRAVTFDVSLGGVYSTNAGATRFDRIETGYVTPALGVNVTPLPLFGWDVGGGAMIDADYYDSTYDDDLGEGRLEGFVFAESPVGPGTFTAEFIYIGTYTNDFSDHDFDLKIVDLTYGASRGGLDAEVSAEYQDSDVPELRRTRLTAMLGHTLAEHQFGHEVTIEGDVAFSDFTSGANSNRNDVTAALVLIAERDLGRGLSLKWEAAFVNRFSNRERSRFTALDLGVEIAKAF
jgi:hypothetical protein